MREVYIIRHGESEANVSECLDISPKNYIFDAELTKKGREQARKTSEKLNDLEFNFVICSPLSRALQTYEIIFSKRNLKLYINPLMREHVAHSCDIGKQPKELQSKFPNIDFGNLEKYWWNNGIKIQENKIIFEKINDLNLRIKKFKKLIGNLKEKRVAVIGHGTFFSKIIDYYLNNCEYEILKFN